MITFDIGAAVVFRVSMVLVDEENYLARELKRARVVKIDGGLWQEYIETT